MVKVIAAVLTALYPLLVFTLLVVLKLPVRVLSLCVIALSFAAFFSAGIKGRTAATSASGGAGGGARSLTGRSFWLRFRPFLGASLFLAAGIACFFTNQAVFLKLYSVAVTSTFLFVFASSLVWGPNIIFRFATMADKSIRNSAKEKSVERYCHKVCIAWCLFFILNAGISAFTALKCSDAVWSLYNGGISYALMGLMFAVEYIIRIQVNKKMPSEYSITKFKNNSRKDDYVLCYENTWSSKNYKTWLDFLTASAKVRAFLSDSSRSDCKEWILHCEDYWYFLCTFTALLQCGKRVLLTQNITPSFIKEIKAPGVEFLTDQTAEGAFSISNIIEDSLLPSEKEIRTSPAIDADKTEIFMYTSGSTGKPKAVVQRMTEFELDNKFIISKWGNEFCSRKLVTTVSQHHIYGFLFGISLPFTLGTPFRRKRIEFPEEFETLNDGPYMIIATPAFLKRTVEIEGKLPTSGCFIFTSGGVLTPDVAEQTDKVFGFWPLEVYGSTETSGIAYRQSKKGLEWTPFDNAKIWKGDDGCLRIISPYIKNPEGFATADLVDILDDGRFLLKGRADSIVKIEEKRISMTEVENRILQTGLVRDVKVIALEDRRQYLAAAIEFNDEGKKKFGGVKKLEVNKFFHDFLMQYFENVVIPKKWRFVEKLPCDVQGKKHKEDIALLFEKAED